MRPRIGITSPEKKFHSDYWLIHLAVWLCGGQPVMLNRPTSLEKARIDGLIISGGTDIHPGLFATLAKENYSYDLERDTLELSCLKKAEQEKLPVMGICRGAQLMNVSHQGSLHMDIRAVYDVQHKTPTSFFKQLLIRRPIEIEPNSLLYRIVGTRSMQVNSMHSQSIDQVGMSFKITAREPNGIVQAIEKEGHPFCIGVQFHPEYLFYRPKIFALFQQLVKTARGIR